MAWIQEYSENTIFCHRGPLVVARYQRKRLNRTHPPVCNAVNCIYVGVQFYLVHYTLGTVSIGREVVALGTVSEHCCCGRAHMRESACPGVTR